MIAGNPFIGGIYETKDGRHVVPSAVYVDLVYQWSTFLSCAVNPIDVAAAIKGWNSRGRYQVDHPVPQVQRTIMLIVEPKILRLQLPKSAFRLP